MRVRAPAARCCVEADGGGVEAGTSSTAALEAAEEMMAGGESLQNPAKRKVERKGGWWRRVVVEETHPWVPFIGAEGGRERGIGRGISAVAVARSGDCARNEGGNGRDLGAAVKGGLTARARA